MHQPSSVAASGLRASAGPIDIHQTIGVARKAQHSQRNICLRRAPEDEQLGARPMLTLEAAPIMYQSLSVVVSGLGASAGPSDTHQTIGNRGIKGLMIEYRSGLAGAVIEAHVKQ
ncbi:hypothetical protein GH714_035498 [Hevea brasiliensis]|uniref:Uncharacterized protein n=1 Tax=Hevea brasiliensis TaxID=3981 RepID=A0A6A6L001_HEVBR|nr:hypothetical protein GH714_035498 [Hevea brasiliensis]